MLITSLRRVLFLTLLLVGCTPTESFASSPIVFIHGLCSSSDTWSAIKSSLLARGLKFGGAPASPFDDAELARYPANADFYLINFTDPLIQDGIESWANELNLYLIRIADFRAAHGGQLTPKFSLVAHSAGGLAARYYLENADRGNVDRLVTYGTPHTGTPLGQLSAYVVFLARLGNFLGFANKCSSDPTLATSLGAIEMESGSQFLTTLNSRGLPTSIQYVSLIGSYSDQACIQNTDCVVSTASQNLQSVPNVITPTSVVTRTSNQWHGGETADVDSILWALPTTGGVPGAPQNLTYSAGLSTVSLSWNAAISGGAPTSYIIEAGAASGLANLATVNTSSTATLFSAGGVGPGTYYVRVRATNSFGQSGPSNEVVIRLGPATLTTLSDDFNSGTLDPLRWEAPTTPGVVVRNQRLEISLPMNADAGAAATVKACLVSGDFDVQVDYGIVNWPGQSSYGVVLAAADPGSTFAIGDIFRSGSGLSPNGVESYTAVVFGAGTASKPTTDLTGQLRLARVGQQMSAYFRSSPLMGWTMVITGSSNPNPAYFTLAIGSASGASKPGVSAWFDNFVVAGRLTCQ